MRELDCHIDVFAIDAFAVSFVSRSRRMAYGGRRERSTHCLMRVASEIP